MVPVAGSISQVTRLRERSANIDTSPQDLTLSYILVYWYYGEQRLAKSDRNWTCRWGRHPISSERSNHGVLDTIVIRIDGQRYCPDLAADEPSHGRPSPTVTVFFTRTLLEKPIERRDTAGRTGLVVANPPRRTHHHRGPRFRDDPQRISIVNAYILEEGKVHTPLISNVSFIRDQQLQNFAVSIESDLYASVKHDRCSQHDFYNEAAIS